VAAIVWFGTTKYLHGNSALSSGPLSSSHAVFGQRCELCHAAPLDAKPWSRIFAGRAKASDAACLSCHNVSPHNPMEVNSTPSCGSCHTEHVGAMHLAATADTNCTQCHARLETRSGTLRVAANIRNFASEHPDFRELRTSSPEDRAAAFALRFNHAGHMHPGLRSPKGPVDLTCQSCHIAKIGLGEQRPAGFEPAKYQNVCRSCHTLEFDIHIKAEAPHAAPEVVRDFVVRAIKDYAASNPAVVAAEIREWTRNPSEWVANRISRAEVLLWRGKCALCHRDLNLTQSSPTMVAATYSSDGSTYLPKIEPTRQPERWFTDAVFSHPAHQAVQCSECHGNALTSKSGSDLLLPSIASCRRCHDGQSSPQGPPLATGHAESGCFLCHLYHGPQLGRLSATHPLADLARR
jgi:hypothetical protein